MKISALKVACSCGCITVFRSLLDFVEVTKGLAVASTHVIELNFADVHSHCQYQEINCAPLGTQYSDRYFAC